jgi:uncharacterized protein (TIGR00255 family)
MPGLRSMTGFGRATAPLARSLIVVEASSVNQRGLAVTVHAPGDWAGMEAELSALARGMFQRGKVTLRISLDIPDGTPDLAEPLAHLRKLAHAHGIPGEPDWEVLLRLSERQTGAVPPLDEAARQSVLACCRAALEALDLSRAREGEALSADLARRLSTLAELVSRMESSAAQGPARQRDRLLRRLADLGLQLDPSDDRVLKELALHADRSDISEEITRLRSHLAQGRGLLDSPAPGRTLDFLTQELLREANTVGSKASEIPTTQAVLEAKVEIERIREQVQNVE